jgi:hypothetical protein
MKIYAEMLAAFILWLSLLLCDDNVFNIASFEVHCSIKPHPASKYP